jgi:4'-phosphopantetheinyl transferase
MEKFSWQEPLADVAIYSRQVHVWRVWLDTQDDLVGELNLELSADEKEKATQFRRVSDKTRYIIAHARMREILNKYLDIPPEDIAFAYNRYGKPELEPTINPMGLNFNLSHSGAVALLAVTVGFKVGVDVEQVKRNAATEEIAHRFFSPGEIEMLISQPENLRTEAFFRCWTRKEAYIKARGEGMSIPLNEFEVNFLPESQPKKFAVDGDEEGLTHWSLFHLEPMNDYVGALAVGGHPVEMKTYSCWGWP